MKVLTLSLLMFLVMFGKDCNRVPRPKSDSTLPTAMLRVRDQRTNRINDFTGRDNLLIVEPDHRLDIYLFGDDPEGVHRIRLETDKSLTFVDGEISQTQFIAIAPIEQILEPDARSTVSTKAILYELQEFPRTSSAGFRLSDGDISFRGQVENYFGGVSEVRLTLTPNPR